MTIVEEIVKLFDKNLECIRYEVKGNRIVIDDKKVGRRDSENKYEHELNTSSEID